MFRMVEVVALILLVEGTDLQGSDCKVQICFTWKVVDNHLIFMCKVNAKKFAVTFWDPNHEEKGFCIPGPFETTCTSLLSGATIASKPANESIYETYFIIKDNVGSQYNGNWRCSYGFQNEDANVDVTILGSDIKTKSSLSCLQSMLFWALLGFCMTFFAVHFFNLIVKKIDRFENVFSCTLSISGRKGQLFLKFIFILAGSLLFCAPLILGLTEMENCHAEGIFVLLGIAVGIYTVVFLKVKDGLYIANENVNIQSSIEEDSEMSEMSV